MGIANDADTNLLGVLRAQAFAGAGWRFRSSSWDAYEVETSWCQVALDPGGRSDTLLNGVVDPDKVDVLATLLSQFGLSFSLELYDANGSAMCWPRPSNVIRDGCTDAIRGRPVSSAYAAPSHRP
ncbi:hypothetical protein HY68_14540 [Streptomyces sp. AcH 505]|uniref:hypothetical protein n=1 Tax=Streptomyces sp. AcH 505 TaxID=352211 RepID=UPI000591FDFE|nr:hypothetical protein HY68_14540 [Streptomyces sp. AcH 505]